MSEEEDIRREIEEIMMRYYKPDRDKTFDKAYLTFMSQDIYREVVRRRINDK